MFSFQSLDTKVKTNVIFAVHTYLDESKSPMKFKYTNINVGNSMDAPSGKFTCKVPGYYQFSFFLRMNPDKDGDLSVRLEKTYANGGVTSWYATDADIKERVYGSLSFSWIVELDRSDSVTLNAYWGKPATGNPAKFSGHLLWST